MSARSPRPGCSAGRAELARWATVTTNRLSQQLHLGGGSVIGGWVGLALDRHLVAKLTARRQVALVSGTNGKTTTTRLLAAAMGGSGQVATSGAGANLPAGVVAALAGAPDGVPAVLEVDEGYLGQVAAQARPAVVVLLNLSRDQLDRVSEVRMVSERWRSAAAGFDGVVVANADDPLVVHAAGRSRQVRWVAAGQIWRADAAGCPVCGGRIVFSPRGLDEPLGSGGGDWACPGCGFRRPRPDATLVDDTLVTAAGQRLGIHLALPGRCNLANAAMAAVAAAVLGVDEADALAAMAGVGDVEGRFAVVGVGSVRARLLLAKNPAGWAELLDLLAGGDEPVVVGINARVADGHDPSWLWDVPFESLAGRLVVATGERCRDLAVRLRYAGIRHRTEPDQLRALQLAEAVEVDYVGNYTAFQELRRRTAGGAVPAGLPAGGAVPTVVPPAVPAPRRPGSAPAPRRPGSAPAAQSALRVVVVHPDLLGTYGDGGNGRVLAARAAWRDLDVDLVLVHAGDPLPSSGDIYCLGGGEDGPQVQAAELLDGGPLSGAVDRGAAVLAVCAGFQIVGTSFPDAGGRSQPGLGLLDIDSARGTGRRAVGEVVARPLPGLAARVATLTGFENHAGVTRLGPGVRPLAQVTTGVGNGAGDGTEGAVAGRVVGTYLHGPVLARNPTLADLLLTLATGSEPRPLDDTEELALHGQRLQAAPGRIRAWRSRRGAVAARPAQVATSTGGALRS